MEPETHAICSNRVSRQPAGAAQGVELLSCTKGKRAKGKGWYQVGTRPSSLQIRQIHPFRLQYLNLFAVLLAGERAGECAVGGEPLETPQSHWNLQIKNDSPQGFCVTGCMSRGNIGDLLLKQTFHLWTGCNVHIFISKNVWWTCQWTKWNGKQNLRLNSEKVHNLTWKNRKTTPPFLPLNQNTGYDNFIGKGQDMRWNSCSSLSIYQDPWSSLRCERSPQVLKMLGETAGGYHTFPEEK